MDSDTPQGEPGTMDLDAAADAFNAFIEPPKEEEKPAKTEAEKPEVEAEPEPEENAQEEGDDAPITVEVDGKQVTLTKEQVAEAYKNGLRQADYTQKTMAVAEQRKAAEAETQKALQERQTYAENLQKMAAQLEGAIQQQEKIDWNALLESDPVEFLKQKHLYDQRQAALQKNQQEQAVLAEKFQAERAKAQADHIQKQQQELLAKLPEWKDEAKAKSERDAIKAYLAEQGFAADDIAQISDHRAVILSRKAMLYDQMIAKAKVAAKKVQNLPTKVVQPGSSTDVNPLDGRTRLMQRLGKSGSIDDAAALFASIL